MTLQKYHFGEEEISKIEKLFSESFNKSESSYSISIRGSKGIAEISVEIIPDAENNFLVSVYTSNTHLQIQSCSNIIVSEMLEEVIFISETEESVSGLIISRQGDCALYSNVSKKVLRTDFSELNSEKLLSAVALSITENIS